MLWVVLLENTAGKLPLWLAPDQVAILPISERFNEYAEEVKQILERQDVRAYVDDRNEKVGRKIRDNELKKVPYMLIVGEKEQAERKVSVRKQGAGDGGQVTIDDFASAIVAEVNSQIEHSSY